MKNKFAALLFAMFFIGLFLGGCAPITPQTTDLLPVNPTQETQPVTTPVLVVELEPFVSISPTSGPSGTLVQVSASGFPPDTAVLVGMGPANAGFGEVAQGITDANGNFATQIVVQGEPGMSFVIAVLPEGQQGVSSTDLFQIQAAAPNPQPNPQGNTPTMQTDMWTTFSNTSFAISLDYPSDWQPAPGYEGLDDVTLRYEGINGFFHINSMDGESLDYVANSEANHRLLPYGTQPTIEVLQVQGQEARLIKPSTDQAGMQNQAALIITYPKPVNISGTSCRYFVLWADVSHILTIAQTIRFHN